MKLAFTWELSLLASFYRIGRCCVRYLPAGKGDRSFLPSSCYSMHKICANSSQTKPKHGDRKRIQIPDLAEQLLATESCWERESPVFFKDVIPDRSAALQWKATHPRVYGQHKLHLMGKKKKEERQYWVGRKGEVDPGGTTGRGEYDKKYVVQSFQRTNI